jgi:hypothetical protein
VEEVEDEDERILDYGRSFINELIEDLGKDKMCKPLLERIKKGIYS